MSIPSCRPAGSADEDAAEQPEVEGDEGPDQTGPGAIVDERGGRVARPGQNDDVIQAVRGQVKASDAGAAGVADVQGELRRPTGSDRGDEVEVRVAGERIEHTHVGGAAGTGAGDDVVDAVAVHVAGPDEDAAPERGVISEEVADL